MSFGVLATTILQLLALAGVGVALRLTGVLKRTDSRVLNSIIVYAALPALIFSKVYVAELSWEYARLVGVAWIVCLSALALAWIACRALRLPKERAGAFLLVAAIGNTGYLGYPVSHMLLGDPGLTRAIFYDVFGTVAVLFTVGIAVASRFGDHSEGAVDVVKELLTFPAMVALLAALVMRLVPVPDAVEAQVIDWLELAGSMAVPLIMVSLGLSLSARGFRAAPAALGAASAVKLVVAPAIAFGAALLLGAGEATRLVVLQASMPTVMLSLVIGERFGLDTEFIASVILTTTVACIATIPLLQLLVP